MNISKISFLTAAMLGTLGQAWAADTTAPTVTASVPSGEYTSVQKIQYFERGAGAVASPTRVAPGDSIVASCTFDSRQPEKASANVR